ncbi:molybdopterin-containing oxidoreductase family protein [Parvibacter caecicola]|uniref:Anaerobic selenocysteine-containing dehydrogenase n=1 Tax=Parvibacter caecicola TaxID=747645 RepID=A0A3N0ABG6_9ACTN|nr:molybdopterin-dependent oxidoreductase [Parvibacter caecicola]MBB3172055.1 anaerobic selenocysteine-containing dehydrogenase [Parvibacter caecicola]MCR2041884.1 molybdopterin-dependent oxidoreductase [Parvibacter caecicola]RNL11320.1 molybdopterin dinucleotide-binding protein [Parvibacter caecicola]TJW11442.1 molybdopterin dinucleotide-binding protein [Parvibacter caecicola]
MGEKVAHTLTRRSFMKMAAATASIAALSTGITVDALAETAAPATAGDGNVERIRSVCRACGKMECGVWVTVQDGKVIRVEGDQSAFTSRGNCCTKSQSSIQACYHPDRLRYPMKRTRPKGEDPGWERVSWDEAMQIAADKFHEVADKYTGTGIFTMNGTSRMWAMGGYATLAIITGAANNHVASCICKGPRFLTTSTTDQYGSNWMTSVTEPRVYVEWGGNIEYSNYDDSCRNVVNATQKAETFIIIDPRMTGVGKEADYWLNVRPGTDAAIALAWAKIIAETPGLMDELYMKRWTNAPFLVVEDMEPSGGWMVDNSGAHDMKTRLLKQSDIDPNGSYQKFFVVDANKVAAGATGNDALSFFDAEISQWDGEAITTDEAMNRGQVVMEGTPFEGWLVEPSQFTSGIDPTLVTEIDVTLADGTVHKARTVWSYYMDMLANKTPEWASEVTGVDAGKIRDACLAWATRPEGQPYGNGGIHISLAMDQNGNNYQTIRAIMMLSHMTGNMDTPTGNRGPTHAYINDECWLPYFILGGTFDASPEAGSKFDANAMKVGGDDWPMTKWYGQWSEPHSIWRAVIDQDPYPIVAGANDSGSFMNQGSSMMAWEAMNKLDFWMEANLWHHPTADCADILVPVYHWLEMEFPRISQGPHCGLAMNVPCVEAPGDCRDDPMFMKAFANAYGFPWSIDPNVPDPDTHESCMQMYRLAQEHSIAQNGERMPFESWEEWQEDFQKNGWVSAAKVYPKEMGTYRRWETGYMAIKPGVGRAEGVENFDIPGCDKTRRFGYVTPTTKYELWPTVLERYGLGNKAMDENSAHYRPFMDWMIPEYYEPLESPVNDPELAKEYPLICTTGRRIPVYFHSEHRQLPWCRENWPVPRMEINPADAEELGLEQGDWAWIETKYGKIRECVDIYYGIDKGVVNLEHAWWFPELSAPNHGEKLCNCNNLLNPDNVDPIMGSPCMRGFAVKVYKATPENSPFGNPVPCDDDGTEIIHDSSDPRLKEWLPDYSLNRSDY